MKPTGTQINYYHLCHRKLWLFSNGLNMEDQSDLVAEGKLIHEQSYPQRAERFRELAIENIKIDHYDPQAKIVREVKKSSKMEAAHLAQVKYYIYVLERNGIDGVHGLLEYPKLRKTEEVWLSEEDRQQIPEWERGVEEIIDTSDCPSRIDKPVCKKCAYYDFCYIDE